ncbi:MAG: hypothetical protein ING65_01565 [Rhodocyclaceae bacterium]|nr:hypothetical protein [Rhodocyclaceae bacterium]
MTRMVMKIGCTLLSLAGYGGFAFANSGFVERIPNGQSATVDATSGDLFVVQARAGITEEELRAISALKVWLTAKFQAAGRSTPYIIDLKRREAQYVDPTTNAFVKLPFSSFM